MKILLAEDDEYLLSGLTMALRHRGYSVECARSGPQTQDALSANAFDLLLLDLGLPGLDGTEVLANLRSRGDDLPVIVITARDSVEDKIHGLDLGANDYLVKPFDFRELEARMRAALRKTNWNNKVQIEFGALILNTNSGSLTLNGNEIDLTRRESMVLKTLMAHQGRVVSKRQLMEQLSDWMEESSENAIEIMVHRLRKKLAAANVVVSTVRGFGYVLEEQNK